METATYQIAKQEDVHKTISFVKETNCTDQENGHHFEWITKGHPEWSLIDKQHPGLKKNGCIVKCTKCGKVSSSM